MCTRFAKVVDVVRCLLYFIYYDYSTVRRSFRRNYFILFCKYKLNGLFFTALLDLIWMPSYENKDFAKQSFWQILAFWLFWKIYLRTKIKCCLPALVYFLRAHLHGKKMILARPWRPLGRKKNGLWVQRNETKLFSWF